MNIFGYGIFMSYSLSLKEESKPIGWQINLKYEMKHGILNYHINVTMYYMLCVKLYISRKAFIHGALSGAACN